MDKQPEPEEILNFEGPEGETLFWHALEHVVRRSFKLQSTLDGLWAHYKDISDERLLAIVAALCVEGAVQELLQAIGPGFRELCEDVGFTFSLQVKTLRGLRLLPSRVLSACDLVRQIRNEFAHHLDKRAFAQLSADRYLRKIRAHVSAFNARNPEASSYESVFKELVGFTLMALITYRHHAEQLRQYLETDAFRQSFKQWNEQRS